MFLIVVTLLSSTLLIWASESDISITDTTVETDLQSAGLDLVAYKNKYGGSAQIITVREYGYTSSSSAYELYVYAYLPDFYYSDPNCVEYVQMLISNGVSGTSYNLKCVDISDDRNFFKLVLKDFKPSTFAKNGIRNYSFSGAITILYQPHDVAYKESVGYNVSESVWFKCSGTDAKDTYSMESNVDKLLTLDVAQTVYRTPTSDKGVGYHYDIFSVYFSVPNEYFEKYEYLKSIDITYREAMWNALVVSTDENKELADKLQGVNFSKGDFNSEYPSLYVNPHILSVFGGVVGGLVPVKTASYVMNNKSNFLYSEYISTITNVFKVADYRDDDLFIPHSDIRGYLPYAEQSENYGVNNKTIEFDKTFDIESFSSGNTSPEVIKNFVKWFYKYNDEVAIDGVKPIEKVDTAFMNGYSTDIDKWCADHLIRKEDAEEFKIDYDASKKNDETLVVLRFAVRDYYAMNSAIDTGYKWTNATNSLYAQGTAFRNFRVINLNFIKAGEIYVVPVYHEALDIGGGLTPGQDNIIDDAVEDFDDWWKKLDESFANIINVIRIVMLLMVVVLLWQPISTVFTLITVSVNTHRNKNKKE